MNTTEVAQARAVIQVIRSIADTIRDLGQVPSGELYARLMGIMTLEQYERVIALLKSAGVVSESNHLLTWIGPVKES